MNLPPCRSTVYCPNGNRTPDIRHHGQTLSQLEQQFCTCCHIGENIYLTRLTYFAYFAYFAYCFAYCLYFLTCILCILCILFCILCILDKSILCILCIFCIFVMKKSFLRVFLRLLQLLLGSHPRAQLLTYHHLQPSQPSLVLSQAAPGKSADSFRMSKGIGCFVCPIRRVE